MISKGPPANVGGLFFAAVRLPELNPCRVGAIGDKKNPLELPHR